MGLTPFGVIVRPEKAGQLHVHAHGVGEVFAAEVRRRVGAADGGRNRDRRYDQNADEGCAKPKEIVARRYHDNTSLPVLFCKALPAVHPFVKKRPMDRRDGLGRPVAPNDDVGGHLGGPGGHHFDVDPLPGDGREDAGDDARGLQQPLSDDGHESDVVPEVHPLHDPVGHGPDPLQAPPCIGLVHEKVDAGLRRDDRVDVDAGVGERPPDAADDSRLEAHAGTMDPEQGDPVIRSDALDDLVVGRRPWAGSRSPGWRGPGSS